MPATYTTNLSLTLPAIGDTNWGTTVNNGITSLIDDSVAGTANITMVAANYTLTTTQGAANEARKMFITATGSPGAARNIIVPAVSKLYFVYNNTTGGFAQTVKTPSGSGVSVPNGARMVLYCNGTDVVDAVTRFSSLTLGSALPVASGGTGVTSSTGTGSVVLSTSPTLTTPNLGTPSAATLTNATGLPLATGVTGTLPVANGGTGITAFGTGVATALGQNVTGSGGIVLATSPTLTTPNLGTPSAATLTNATGLPISTGVSGLGTGVATALGVNTGSAGAFVVNGGALGTPSSGTATNLTGLPLSTGVTGTLPVANGGTGITAFGTGVATALGVNTGSAGAFVVNGGALGTPSSGTLTNATGLPLSTGVTGTLAAANGGTGVTSSTGSGSVVLSTSPTLTTPNLGTPSAATLTNATGLPISTGVSGLGTGVATALGVNTGSAGAFVVNGGALGTPSSGTLTNATGLPLSTGVTGTLAVANGGTGITAFGTGVATALGVNTGSAGAFVVNGGALGTPSAATLTNATGLPLSTGVTGTLGGANGGTGITSFGAANRVPYAASTTALTTNSGFTFDGSTLTVDGINISKRANAETTAIGNGALSSSGVLVGPANTAVGYGALNKLTAGYGNTSVGRYAGYNATEYYNVFVGDSAGYDVTTGYINVAIGFEAGLTTTTGYANVSIGKGTKPSAANGHEQITVGTNLTGKGNSTAYIGGSSGAYNQKNVTTWETTSDARIKKNIVDNTQGLDVIKQIRVRNFEYRTKEEITELPEHSVVEKPGVQLGVIAQELQQVLPNCVTENSTGVLSVNTDSLIWHLVNAVKQLSEEIVLLKAKM